MSQLRLTSRWQAILKRKPFESTAFLAFIILMAVSLFTHTPWRDEAQSYLLIRDLSFGALFQQLKYEGHPIVWYALLFPWIKMGLPIIVQNIISSTLAVGSAYIILFKSPFQRSVKLFFLLSSPVLFMASVIGRSYALLAFLFLVILAIQPERYGRRYLIYGISLFLLINTHLYAAVIAGALLVADLSTYKKGFWKDKHVWFVWIMFILGTMLVFITDYPGSFYAQYQQHFLNQAGQVNHLTALFFRVSVQAIFYGSLPSAYLLLQNFHFMLSIVAYLSLSLFAMVLAFLTTDPATRRYSIAFYLTCLFGMVFLTMLTQNYNQHMGGIFVLVLWGSLWLIYPTALQGIRLAIIGLTLVLLTNNYALAIYCLNHPYSGAKGAADYVISENLDRSDTLIVAPYAARGSAILPYLKNIQQIKTPEGFISYVDWRNWQQKLSTTPQEIEQLVGKDANEYQHILLVIPRHDQQTSVQGKLAYPLIYNGEKSFEENIQIYEVK